MKRYLSLLLMVILALSLFACAAPAEPAKTAGPQASDAEPTEGPAESKGTVYWCANNTANEFSVNMAKYCEEIGKENGYKVIVLDSDTDVATQISDVETAIAANATAIFIDPTSTDGLNAVLLSAVKDHNIPVICIHGGTSNQEELTAFVACDMFKGGEIEMQMLADDLDGKGKIAILRSTEGHDVANNITDGYYAVLENYPDIEVVYVGVGDWGADSATPYAETWLTATPDLNAIICNNDGMALGVRPVVASMGLEETCWVYGLDAISEARMYIREGGCYKGSIMMDTYAEFLAGFDILNKFLAGEPFENKVVIDPVGVNAANIDELYPDD